MKKVYLLLMAIMFFAMQSWSQTTLNESFEGATFPPEDWTIITTSGIGNWQISTDMAHTGIKSTTSAYASGGCTRWLITPKLSVTSNVTNFTFWIATNYWYSDGDNIDILVSTTDNETPSFSTTSLLSLNQDSVTTAWMQYSVDLSTYIGQDIYVAIRVIDNFGFSTFIDDITGPNLFIPTCRKPTLLTTSNITTNYAEITWTAGGSETNWTLQYKLSSDDWTNATEVTNVTSGYQIQGLNPSSSYDVRVKSVCTVGIDESDWTNAVTFRTQCGAISSFPWTEGFESDWTVTILPGNATAPDCWINVNGGYDQYLYWQRSTGTFYATGSSYARTGNGAATIYGGWTSSSTYNNSDWLISPVFTLTGTEALNFYTKSMLSDYPEDISIYILDVTTNGDISSAADTSNFIRIYGPEVQPTSWLFHEISLPYTGNYRIAFVRNSLPGGVYTCLDDITIAEMPLCPNTYNLTSSLRSATEVDLNWMQNGNGNGWVIAYGDTTAFDPATSTQTITISSTDPVPYTVNGLTPQTSYSFAVRQNCTDGAWSNIVSVTTPAIAATLPYTHDFEDVTENGKWTFINGTQTNQWFIGSAADTLGTNGLYISNDAGVTNAYTVGTSRVYAYRDFEVPVGAGEIELSFDWRAKGGTYNNDFLRMYLVPLDANITAGVIPPNGLDASAQIGNYTGGNGEHWLSQSTVWQHQTMRINSLQFPNLAGRTWRLLVHWRNESSTTSDIQPPAAVDNISLTVVTCPSPSALAASNITTTSVLLTWQENGSATDWIIEYKPSSSTTWTTYQTVSNPDSIINLMPGTSYNVRLRSLCSDTSLYSNTITFQTICATEAVPTPVEGFLTTVPPTTCWSRMQGALPATGNATLTTTTSGWRWNSDITQHNATLEIYTSLWLSSPTNYWLISPSINLNSGTTPAQLEFDVFYTDAYSSNAPSTGGTDDRFAVVVSTDDGLTWNAANATIWSNEAGATRVLNNITNTPTHIILPLFDPATTLPYTGNIKVGFYGESTASNADNDLHIDNFEVLPYSTCQRPTSVSASNITSSDATISFTENGVSTTWEYVYGDATTVIDPTTETAISTTDNLFQLTGLTPQTQYNVWVHSICDNGNSDWSVLCTFVTEALPATLPYTCGFEDANENLAWKSLSNGINKWATGTAAGNGTTSTGTQANYISNDNGVSYAMTSGNIYSYTYRDIDFGTDPASYNLSFDWKCQGYVSSWDNSMYAGLRVYLRDTSETISTSWLPTNPDDNLGSFYNDSTWQNAQLPVDNVSGVKRLMFVYFDQYSNYAPPAAIDNISLVQATCPRPYDVIASNLTTTTADISWVHPGADSYIVSYRPASGTTLTDEAATASPYTIQGLTLGTQYIVSVRAICSSDTTTYSTTITFQTPCSDIAIAAFPWIEGFENGLNCWQQEIITGTTNWINNSFEPNSESNSAFFNWIIGDKTKLISPLLDISIISQPYLSFWHKQEFYFGSQDELKVLYRENADSAWTQLFHFTSSISIYQKDSIALPEASSTYQIAFEGLGGNGNGIYLDDIEIYDNNNCISPTNINIQNITTTSCDISWTTGDQETGWQVRLGLDGTPIDINTNSYQFTTGLTPATNYTVYVRANCGTGFSAWVSQTFTTTPVYQLPTVTTIQENGTTQTSTTLNGSYIQGTNPILVKGFEWKESSASAWNIVQVSAGTTPFVYALNGLFASTQYEFRAYVETSLDTTYGAIIQFTTLDNVLPNVTTTAVTNITQTTATFNGTTAQGSESIQARGFEYKQTSTDTWTGAIDVTATGTTTIMADVTGLTANTEYDVRAYAQTQTDDRTYGNIETFRTDSVSGLSDMETNHFLVSMYPNPTTNTTKLVVSGVEGETDIIINDVQGKLIYQTTAKAANGKVEKTIDVNSFAKGVYYVRIQNQTTSRTQKLIVIN